jgi:transcriptional regulator GlxA family with amidase domain
MRHRRGMTTVVGIVVFDEVEVLDACGPFEVFSVANRVADRLVKKDSRAGRHRTAAPFDVVTIAAGEHPEVVMRGGLRVTASHVLTDAPVCDVVMVSGGVVDRVESDEGLLAWLRTARNTAEVVASVCTGAFVLARAGILSGRVTTHAEDAAALADRHSHLDVVTNARFVDQGDTATSAGVSAGVDLSLHLVERYAGTDLAMATARQMEWPWEPGLGDVVSPLAGEGLI